MGSSPSLFEDLAISRKPTGRIGLQRTALPVWSRNKSEFILDYIRRFQYVTKSGVIIDGFAGPQNDEHRDELWTAKKLLELRPAWIKKFYLCDADRSQYMRLKGLKDGNADITGRSISVFGGDFNRVVDTILAANTIRRNTPAFALLDMRTFECSWATVQKLATYKSTSMKIEILYFLATGWLQRAASRTEERELERWWGNSGWRRFIQMSNVQLAEAVCDRFQDEFGYRSAVPFPIFKADDSKRVFYYLIHATDHEVAQKLMEAAYRRVCGERLSRSTPGAPMFDF